MSIDGIIKKITHDDLRPVLHIELSGRRNIDGSYSSPGQPYMRIIKPSWTPEIGMTVWGSSSSVLIGPDQREYRRWGYTKIFEANAELEEEFRALGWAGT